MGRRFAPLELDEVERAELTSLASRRSTAQGLALRARIILACAEGEQSKAVAARLGIDPDTVGKWRRRFTTEAARISTSIAVCHSDSSIPSSAPS
jgi:FixJ family two-component response regulator